MRAKELRVSRSSQQATERRSSGGILHIPRSRDEWVAEGVDWIKSIVIVLAIFLPVMTFIVQGYRIPSGSMEDTLLVGDFLFADKITYGARIPFDAPHRLPGLREPKAGDVVIFKSPETGETLIKRCVAIGGQTVEVRNKVLYVDGEPRTEPYVKHIDPFTFPAQRAPRDNYGPLKVPVGYIFLMGDNRDASRDCRFFGPVRRELVIAKADILYFSFNTKTFLPRIGRIGKVL